MRIFIAFLLLTNFIDGFGQVTIPYTEQDDILPVKERIIKCKIRSITEQKKSLENNETRITRKVFYDRKGNMIRLAGYNRLKNSIDSVSIICDIGYDSLENVIYEHIILKDHDNPNEWDSACHKFINHYDNLGQLVRSEDYFEDWDSVVSRKFYTYNENGARATEEYLGYGNQYSCSYFYDSLNRLSMISSNINAFYPYYFTYDAKGNLQSIRSTNNIRDYGVNKKGWLTEVVHNAWKPAYKQRFYYTRNGLLKRIENYYFVKGKALIHTVNIYEYEYYD